MSQSGPYQLDTDNFGTYLVEIGCGIKFVDDLDETMSFHYGRKVASNSLKESIGKRSLRLGLEAPDLLHELIEPFPRAHWTTVI